MTWSTGTCWKHIKQTKINSRKVFYHIIIGHTMKCLTLIWIMIHLHQIHMTEKPMKSRLRMEKEVCVYFLNFVFLFFFQAKSKKEKISNSYITHFTLSIFCLLSCRYLSKFCNLLGYLVMFGFFSYVYFLYHFWIPSCFVQEFTLAQIPFF